MESLQAFCRASRFQSGLFFGSRSRKQLDSPSNQLFFPKGAKLCVYASPVGYSALLLPARPISSSSTLINRCVLEAVAGISVSQDDGDEEFPSSPGENEEAATKYSRIRQQIIARVDRELSEGSFPPYVVYLMDLGLTLEQIEKMTRRYANLATSSVEKIEYLVSFLSGLGLSNSDIVKVLYKCPTLCGFSIEDNLVPKMQYIESLGADVVRVICRYPNALQRKLEKLEATAAYLSNLGVPVHRMGSLLNHHPQLFGLSVTKKLQPTTKFLSDKGFTKKEIGKMVSAFGALYTLSLEKGLMPKWEFFLQMCYPQSDLVQFPHYFGYSLEKRIKPRYNHAGEYGVQLKLTTLLTTTESKFKRILVRKFDGDW